MVRRWYPALVPHVVQVVKGSGGVVYYTDDHLRRPVLLRFHRAVDGRFEVQEVYLPPEPNVPVRSEHLLIPMSRIEAQVNAPGLRDRLVESFQAGKLSLEDAAFLYRSMTTEQPMESTARRARRRSLRLVIPTTRRYPDGFYDRLAEVYGDLATEGRRPAAAIAEANGVPVSQVHGWIKEARRRGSLSPGRPGRAG